MNVTIVIPGIPQPRGSKRAMPNRAGGRPLMVDTNAKSKPWMAAIASAAQEAMDGRPLLGGPLRLEVKFMFPRPKHHYGSGKNASTLKASAPLRHSTKPDWDKLARAVGDALTGVVWRDDSQVAFGAVSKFYTNGAAETVIDVSYF